MNSQTSPLEAEALQLWSMWKTKQVCSECGKLAVVGSPTDLPADWLLIEEPSGMLFTVCSRACATRFLDRRYARLDCPFERVVIRVQDIDRTV